jgi:hypothetical protein
MKRPVKCLLLTLEDKRSLKPGACVVYHSVHCVTQSFPVQWISLLIYLHLPCYGICQNTVYFNTFWVVHTVIKSREVRWERHIVCMREMRSPFTVLVRKPDWKISVGRYRLWLVDNIKIDLQGIVCKVWNGFICFRIGEQWRALVNTDDSPFSLKCGQFLKKLGTGFFRSTQSHEASSLVVLSHCEECWDCDKGG